MAATEVAWLTSQIASARTRAAGQASHGTCRYIDGRPRASAAGEGEVERAIDVGSVVDDSDPRVEVGPAVNDRAVQPQPAGEHRGDSVELGADQRDVARLG